MDNEKNLPEEEEGVDIFTLTDEDGNEKEFEVIDCIEVEGVEYFALIPEDSEEEYVLLKKEKEENGEDVLVTIDDDEEFDRIADIFEDRMNEVDLDGDANN